MSQTRIHYMPIVVSSYLKIFQCLLNSLIIVKVIFHWCMQGKEGRIKRDELEEMMKTWDCDGDNKINFAEFATMMADTAIILKDCFESESWLNDELKELTMAETSPCLQRRDS